MARPVKTGLDYYPLNVDFLQDIKVRKIMRACGTQSIAILISLLSSIYRDEGYYVVWDEDMSFLVADEIGASEGAALEVVKKAVQVGFFNGDIFEEYKVLTSKGIQDRFLGATTRRKRVDLILEYLVVDLDNDYKNLVNVNINSINVGNNKQSKEEKSKVKNKDIKLQKDCNSTTDEDIEFSEDSEEIRLARFMIDEMLRVKPDSKVPSKSAKSLQSWAQHIDYMIRLDSRTARDIAELFRWAQEDSFWCANVRSPRKLREKWDSLELQQNRGFKDSNQAEDNTKDYGW